MKTHAIDVDKTIENITDALAENAQPQVRGAPTQHAIDKRPEEITPEIYAMLMGASDTASEMRRISVAVGYGSDPQASLLSGATEVMLHLAESSESASERLREMQQEMACLPGVDMSQRVDYGSIFRQMFPRHWYEVRCKQCNFRFASRTFDAEDTNLFDLGCLHSNRNQHKVSFQLGNVTMTIEPEKQTLWSRYKDFCKRVFESKWWAVVCLCFIAWEIFSASMQTGFSRWFSVGLVGLWCYNLWIWGKHKWQNRNDRDTAMGG